jgi:hypothetical protein
VVGTRDLEREVVGLRPARGEREDRIVHRHEGGEPFGELDGHGVGGAGIERGELQRRRLVGHALGDVTATVADHPRAQVIAGVEQAAAGIVEQVRALAARDHARIQAGVARLEVREVREEVPEPTLCEPSRRLGLLRNAERRGVGSAWTH